MTREERIEKLRHLITCMKCEVSGKSCDNNCPTQYNAGNMGEIIENLEEIAKILEQEPCEDAISRDKAIVQLSHLQSDWDDDWNVAIRKCIEAVKIVPSVNTQPKTDWIPVSERLPEKYSYTLWCASSGYVRSDYFNGEYWEGAKKFCYDVIAWMPLPEPYKESDVVCTYQESGCGSCKHQTDCPY